MITGGAGFLGARLARTILAAGTVAVNGDEARPVTRITVLDRVPVPADLAGDLRLQAYQLDLRRIDADRVADADAVFHLAGAVSGECEADFDLGLEANLRAGLALLEACRAAAAPPVFVFASSLAVFGQWPGAPLPDLVTDTTLPTPVTSYGIQKYVLEQLVTDYTRKGFVIGRPVRLATVSVRPGRPNAAASGFLSGIIREPLAGQRAVCPVGPETPVALSSPSRTIAGLLRAAAVSSAQFGPPIAMNLPSISTTVGAMVDALSSVAGPGPAALIDWVPDPAIAAIVANWPARVAAARANGLGLTADPDFTSLVREYLDA
jgi:nucleoside-diphosphate-sugar epimerase